MFCLFVCVIVIVVHLSFSLCGCCLSGDVSSMTQTAHAFVAHLEEKFHSHVTHALSTEMHKFQAQVDAAVLGSVAAVNEAKDGLEQVCRAQQVLTFPLARLSNLRQRCHFNNSAVPRKSAQGRALCWSSTQPTID